MERELIILFFILDINISLKFNPLDVFAVPEFVSKCRVDELVVDVEVAGEEAEMIDAVAEDTNEGLNDIHC